MTPKWQRIVVFGLITLGVVFVGLFGLRTLHAFRQFRGHPPFPPPGGFSADAPSAETDVELIRDWMTIPFIAKVYRVPQSVLYKELNISPQGNRDKSLKDLNEEYYSEAPGIVEAKVKAAVLANLPPSLPVTPTLPIP